MKVYLLAAALLVSSAVAYGATPTEVPLPPVPAKVEAALEPIPASAATSQPCESCNSCNTCGCESCKCYPVARFLAREFVGKPVYAVERALLKAEARELDRRECRLQRQAPCLNECELSRRTERLECAKHKYAQRAEALCERKACLFPCESCR